MKKEIVNLYLGPITASRLLRSALVYTDMDDDPPGAHRHTGEVRGVLLGDTRPHTDGTLRVRSLLLAAEGVIEEDIIHARTHTDGTLRIHSRQQRVRPRE